MKRTLFFAIWLAFVVVLLQLAGWVYVSVGGPKSIEGYGYPVGLFVRHPQLGYLYRAGFSGLFNGAGYRDIPIDINAQGFRDQPFRPATENRARIAFVGDSVVFGAGVRAEDRFTECLETETHGGALAPSAPAPEILNLGVNSYTFGHYLRLAELSFLDLAPSAVVVGITLNDFAPMHASGPLKQLRREEAVAHALDWWQPLKDRIGGTYAARFLADLAARVRYALMSMDQREEYHTKWMRTVVAAWEQPEVQARFAAELAEFQRLAEANAIPVGFVVFPELNDLADPASFSGPRASVLELLEESGARVCDPYPSFAQATDPGQSFLAHDDVHYSSAGHRRLCTVVQRCLADWGFLQP